jgi:hypothetical protein
MPCDIIGFAEKCRMLPDAPDDGGFVREDQFRPAYMNDYGIPSLNTTARRSEMLASPGEKTVN